MMVMGWHSGSDPIKIVGCGQVSLNRCTAPTYRDPGTEDELAANAVVAKAAGCTVSMGLPYGASFQIDLCAVDTIHGRRIAQHVQSRLHRDVFPSEPDGWRRERKINAISMQHACQLASSRSAQAYT
uniref:Uncharacterized protein n=1 Tax=Haptolina ericina TaxID=156174 RepID=A0A7S3BLN7_9EUKA|mmetsp:Transcript_62176/g.138485  ORF Transcript_62176/g.138485 Transcript_62176/m.138485 type:complete len:127 (+) Transcript_62176:276-656(+)